MRKNLIQINCYVPERHLNYLLKYKLSYLIVGMMLLCSGYGYSQAVDTTNIDSLLTGNLFNYHAAKVEFFTGSNWEEYSAIDTSLNYIQRYNPARKLNFENAYLGNLGAPYYSKYFTFERTLGFDYGRHERDAYLMDINEVKYYRCNVPFTDLYYMAGGQGEQLFHVTHTRNFGKDFNIAIDFNKIVSEGYFQYMKTDYSDVTLSGWYKSKNARHSLFFAGIRSNMKQQENGGIANDTVFEIEDPASALPLRDQALTNWDNWQGQIQQQLLFGKQVSYQIDDTTAATYFAPRFALKHTIGYHKYYFQFEDPSFDRTYYNEIEIDTDTLRDRTEVAGFYNRLSFGNSTFRNVSKDSIIKNPVLWEIYGLQQYHELSDQSGKIQFNNLIAGFNFNARYLLDSALTFRLNGAYDLEEGTYEAKASLRFIRLSLSPEIFASYCSYNQTVIQEHYSGFDYTWDNDFDMMQYLKLGAKISAFQSKFDLVFTYETITNFVQFEPSSFDGEIFPSATDESIFKVYLAKDFTLGNFHFNNRAGIQLNDGALEVPMLIASGSWYYENHLFKSALFFQTGLDIWYNSQYNNYGYDIITGQFIRQGFFGSGISSEPYPTFDFFANFDVETLRFFVKVDNVAQGLFGKGTYIAPNYPIQPRAFRLGLNWFLFY